MSSTGGRCKAVSPTNSVPFRQLLELRRRLLLHVFFRDTRRWQVCSPPIGVAIPHQPMLRTASPALARLFWFARTALLGRHTTIRLAAQAPTPLLARSSSHFLVITFPAERLFRWTTSLAIFRGHVAPTDNEA